MNNDMPTKLEEIKEEAKKQIEFTRKTHGLKAPALEDYSSWLIDRAFQAGVESTKDKLAEVPRVVINNADGSKTVAILEHSLKTHDLDQQKKDLLTGKGSVL